MAGLPEMREAYEETLTIITGHGKGSVERIAAVKREVLALLALPEYVTLRVREDFRNPGLLRILTSDLSRWIIEQRRA